MELMESGESELIDRRASDVSFSAAFSYRVHSLSPRSLAQRRQIPLRSLENTDLSDHNSAKPLTMVCSEIPEDNHHTNANNHEPQNNTLSQDSNSCPAFSSHKCPYQKSNFCARNTNQISHSAPNGLNHNMVRATNCRLASAGCIFKNGENLKTDKKDSSSNVRIRTDAFTDSYTVDVEIGRGKFAVVKRCQHKTSGLKYAAKFLRKRRKGKDCRAEVLHEIKMLDLAIVHPRLVNMLEVFETVHEIIIVTEYAEGGELFQRVCVDENFEEQESRRLMRQILEGILFLHERNIVHLDIKPQNILLTSKGPKSNIKICDLGFARPINSGEDVRDIIGTPDYVAPEILSYEPIHIGSDMWSIGVLTYVILTGLSPFAGDTKQETFLNISQVNLDFPSENFGHISKQAVDFISKLLVINPEERLSAQECLNHPWLQMTPTGSPIGQRRCLTPPSPDTQTEEPTKKCRCDIASPTPSPSTSCGSHSCESCDEDGNTTDGNTTDGKDSMRLGSDSNCSGGEKDSCTETDTPTGSSVTEKYLLLDKPPSRPPSPPPLDETVPQGCSSEESL